MSGCVRGVAAVGCRSMTGIIASLARMGFSCMENDSQPTKGNEGRTSHTSKFSEEALQFSSPISKLGDFVDA
jgi:hypothetical protein